MALNDFLRLIPTHMERVWAWETKKHNVIACLMEKYRKDLPYVIFINGKEKMRISDKSVAYREYNTLFATY